MDETIKFLETIHDMAVRSGKMQGSLETLWQMPELSLVPAESFRTMFMELQMLLRLQTNVIQSLVEYERVTEEYIARIKAKLKEFED